MRRANIVTSIVLLIFAAYVFWDSIRMNYKTPDGVPGPGFIPLWTSIFIALVALIILYLNGYANKPDSAEGPGFDKRFWFNSLKVIGGSAISILLVEILGMILAIGLLTGFLSWTMGTKSWKTNLILTVLTPIFFYFVFQQGLEVNFPKGILGF